MTRLLHSSLALAALALPLAQAREPQATAVEHIKVPEGFQVELLYSVPIADKGSWVVLAIDDQGRLITSDQYGGLFRITVPPVGTGGETSVEKIPVDLGGAQGLLFHEGALYAVLNTENHGGRGLYRVTDASGDGMFDTVEQLKKFPEEGGEHGPHAVLLGPDGESLYIVVGNQTPLPPYDLSLVPEVWGEDLLLPRIYGRGFMKGVESPRGWIAKTDLDGKHWTIICNGLRNQYDAAFNAHGELFTFDADMEWDMNTPWYRPTRVNHVTSGSEFGWRNGSGKWPAYYPDSLGAVVDVGPGSPTGVAFGYGAKFPARYQQALFICDWSYGKLYAVHLAEDGSSYTGELEDFLSAQPLPLTDLLVNPADGALYFAIGGRRVQSGLYRLTYVGDEDTSPVTPATSTEAAAARALRHSLETYHAKQDPAAVVAAWPHLASPDRAIRFAARTALEHQPANSWKDRALAEQDPATSIAALIALARTGDPSWQPELVQALLAIDPAELEKQLRLDLLRATALTFIRLGKPSPDQAAAVVARWAEHFPARSWEENFELATLHVYLQHPPAAATIVGLLEAAPTQEEQIHYAMVLRLLEQGWSPELQESYFSWFPRAFTYKGGASFGLFLEDIKNDAIARLSEDDKARLQPILDRKPESDGPIFTIKPREFVKDWKVADLEAALETGLDAGRDFENGRNLFGATGCFACHRFDQAGGAIGPDLSSVAGKFSPRDLLEAIIEPSKEISDQYGATVFELEGGGMVVGRVMNLNGENIRINTNMYAPDETVSVEAKKITNQYASPVSMMPPGLINTLEQDDILDLLAYMLSSGDPDDARFETP